MYRDIYLCTIRPTAAARVPSKSKMARQAHLRLRRRREGSLGLPWRREGVEYVVGSTVSPSTLMIRTSSAIYLNIPFAQGVFATKEKAAAHLKCGGEVRISALCRRTHVRIGCQRRRVHLGRRRRLQCLVPLAKVIHDRSGILGI